MSRSIADDGATIFALSTPPGVGGVAVIRISGGNVDPALAQLTRRPLPAPRVASLRRLHDGVGDLLDEALVLRFPEGASFTGEPVAELHCHGSRAVVAAVMRRLAELPGLRPAQPGEFTRRALLNGRLDLAQVEALGDLISAETERQRRAAVRGLDGGLHQRAEGWRTAVLDILASVEVTIDWADEDVPDALDARLAAAISDLAFEIGRELSASHGLERLREGFEVAIIGAPNCGKSSFINYLAQREAAIASPYPGTTRDVIELRYDLRGLPVTFLDMAGLRAAGDEIESLGVARAIARAESADLRLHFRTADAPDEGLAAALWRPGDLSVWTKSDLGDGPADFRISTLDGTGFADLLTAVHDVLGARIPEDAVASRERHRAALGACQAALDRAGEALERMAPELVAEELRAALGALGRLVGRVGVEDVLDRVFASFCLGK